MKQFLYYTCKITLACLFFISIYATFKKPIHRVKRDFSAIVHYNDVPENEIEFNYNYDVLLEKLNTNKSRLYALPYFSGNTFRGMADHVIDDKKMSGLVPGEVKERDIIYVKVDYVGEFLEKFHERIEKPYILITHNGDWPAGDSRLFKFLEDDKMIAWYGQNMISKHPKLHPIPIGIANERWPQGNITILKEVSQTLKPFHERKNLLYIQFSVSTNKNIRGKTLQYFLKTWSHHPTVFIPKKNMSWRDYLLKLGNTQFVISPPGNGIDCHRTWETLAMGAVPIVLRSNMTELYENMPVMVVDRWEDVTEESLSDFKLRLNFGKGQVPIRQKIWGRYWLEIIGNIKRNYVK